MSVSETTTTNPERARSGPWAFNTIARLVVTVVFFVLFGLVYAYNTWAGWGNFLGIQNQRLQLGLNLTGLGWFVIIADVVIPALVYIGIFLAFFIHAVLAVRNVRPMRVWLWLWLLVIGLVVVAVVNLDLVLGVSQYAIFDTTSAG